MLDKAALGSGACENSFRTVWTVVGQNHKGPPPFPSWMQAACLCCSVYEGLKQSWVIITQKKSGEGKTYSSIFIADLLMTWPTQIHSHLANDLFIRAFRLASSHTVFSCRCIPKSKTYSIILGQSLAPPRCQGGPHKLTVSFCAIALASWHQDVSEAYALVDGVWASYIFQASSCEANSLANGQEAFLSNAPSVNNCLSTQSVLALPEASKIEDSCLPKVLYCIHFPFLL